MIEALLARVQAAGVSLSVKAGKLRLAADQPIDPALQAELVQHKQEVLDWLTRPPPPEPPAPLPAPGVTELSAVPATPAEEATPRGGWRAPGLAPPPTIRLNQQRRQYHQFMLDLLSGKVTLDSLDW